MDKFLKLSSIRYLFISCLVTVVDIAIVYAIYLFAGRQIVFANTVGVVTGFVLHYFLAKKFVFVNAKGFLWAFQYIVIFLIGLVLSNTVIWFVYEKLGIILLIAKILSIIIPYFFMYFTRKYLYSKS